MKTSKRQRRTAAALTAPIRAGRKEVWSSPAEPKRTTAHSFSNKTKCSLRVLRGTCSFSETHEDWRLYETVQHDCRRHIPRWCHHQVTAADSSVYVFPPPPHLSVRSSEPGTPDWRRHFHTCRGAECEGVVCVERSPAVFYDLRCESRNHFHKIHFLMRNRWKSAWTQTLLSLLLQNAFR